MEESRLGQRVREDEAVEVIQRDAVQPMLGVGVGGTPGQIDATVSVQPVGLVGASLGIVSSEYGRASLLTFSANPLAISGRSPGARAWLSRLLDVSLVLPAPLLGTPPVEAFGVRSNIDFVGAAVARRELDLLSAAFLDAQRQELTTGSGLREELRHALDTLPPAQRTRCLDTLFNPASPLEDIAAACSHGLPERLRAAALASSRFQQALDDFEDAVDTAHGGLQVQVDVPATRLSPAPFHAALLGAGTYSLTRDIRAPWRVDLSASLGPDYLLRSGEGALGGTLAVALGVKARLLHGMPRLHSSLGLRGHLGQPTESRPLSVPSWPGNYLQVQLGLGLPIGRTGVAVTGGMNWSVVGEHSGHTAYSANLTYSLPGRAR
ncbi:MAG TPA: hypothetical protein VFZ09_38915 [Archangium sp.]|uniref:hypothetical protein n=1 Tax=Archangium sp. TaxID=1872627 RepID=UPI002E3144DE|nr:hypothetical protein [Archangium sp.]HEX5752249.1 hypothetical protein [Archangium sp.]